MALPDYTSPAGYGSTAMSKRQVVRERRGARRDRRQIRRENRRAGTGVAPTTPGPIASPSDYTIPQQGYSGPYVAPSNSVGHPFFDPNSNYMPIGGSPSAGGLPGGPGATPQNIWGTTESPEGYYYAALNQMGLGGMDARSQAAQSMYGDMARGYQAAKGTKNFELWFPEFIGMQNIPQMLENMSNEQLGIDEQRRRGNNFWALRG